MFEKRIIKLQKLLKAQGIDAMLVSNPANVYYLSGFRAVENKYTQPLNDPEALLLVTTNDCLILADARIAENVKKLRSVQFKEIPYPSSPQNVAKVINDITRNSAIIAFEEDFLLYSDLNNLKLTLNTEITLNKSELLEEMRIIKDTDEIELLTEAAGITNAGFEFALTKLTKGITEKELAFEITSFFLKNAEGNSFSPVVAFGSSSSIPHYEPTNRKIDEEGVLLIDLGCIYRGYCGDMTRTLYIGNADNKFRKIYQTVLEAQQNAITSIRSGMTGREIDALARSIIDNKGFGQNFTHGTGHGLGIAIHEHPYVRKVSETVFKDGMVFSVEPGIYLPDFGGVRIEDIVCLQNGKAVNLTNSPKELIEIEL